MQIAALIFDNITPLDIVGPVEVLSRLPGAELVIVGKSRGLVRDKRTHWALEAEAALSEVPRPDIVLIPGGPGIRPLCQEAPVLDWVRQVHRTSTWTASVCTGALLLGAAGLLKGLTATTHWNAREALEAYGARYVEDRVVEHGKLMIAAGVSSGIDLALRLASRIAGDETAQAIQLAIEYDPQPPYDTGAPSKAGPAVLERARQLLQRRAPAG